MRLADYFRLFFGFWTAVITFTPPIVVGWIVPIGWRRVIFYWPWLIFSKCVMRIFAVKVAVEGREKIKPGYHRRRLYISNHQSALDIPLLVSIYPIPFLTKRENLWIPFVGLAGLLAGSVSFDRNKQSERKRVISKIIDRVNYTSLYIFPEGTRSKDGETQTRVYPALLRAAWRAGVDVVPIALHGSFLVIGHKPPDGGRYPVSVKIGDAIEAVKFEDDRAFAEHCWRQVVEMHRALSVGAEGAEARI